MSYLGLKIKVANMANSELETKVTHLPKSLFPSFLILFTMIYHEFTRIRCS